MPVGIRAFFRIQAFECAGILNQLFAQGIEFFLRTVTPVNRVRLRQFSDAFDPVEQF